MIGLTKLMEQVDRAIELGKVIRYTIGDDVYFITPKGNVRKDMPKGYTSADIIDDSLVVADESEIDDCNDDDCNDDFDDESDRITAERRAIFGNKYFFLDAMTRENARAFHAYFGCAYDADIEKYAGMGIAMKFVDNAVDGKGSRIVWTHKGNAFEKMLKGVSTRAVKPCDYIAIGLPTPTIV